MNAVATICLIDDDSVYQFVTTNNIRKVNDAINILGFRNGEEAMVYFKEAIVKNECLPEIVLLDINMPMLDGWQFLDEYITIKSQIKSPIHIYMTSSSLDSRDIDRAKGYEDVRRFLHKPIDTKTIQSVIKEFNDQ